MSMRSALMLILGCAASACHVDPTYISCSNDSQCPTNYVCGTSSFCAVGTPKTDAGNLDAGNPDAGVDGGSDAGPADSGDTSSYYCMPCMYDSQCGGVDNDAGLSSNGNYCIALVTGSDNGVCGTACSVATQCPSTATCIPITDPTGGNTLGTVCWPNNNACGATDGGDAGPTDSGPPDAGPQVPCTTGVYLDGGMSSYAFCFADGGVWGDAGAICDLNSLCATPDYVVDGGIVYDQVTGVQWQRGVAAFDGGIGPADFATASSYCANLDMDGMGWALPTLSDLYSLVDLGWRSPVIDQDAFPSSPSAYFWTSTAVFDRPGNEWIITFASGGPGSAPTDVGNYYVRCMRSSATDCMSNADCSGNEYCAGTGCGTIGYCAEESMQCQLADGGSVCGCDGMTYSNSCYASQSGVRVTASGGCTAVDAGTADAGPSTMCSPTPPDVVTCPAGRICDLNGHCDTPNYTAADGIVTDNVTGLQWQENVEYPDGGWDMLSEPNAQNYCSGVNLNGINWQLPTAAQLFSLVDTMYSPMIDPSVFSSTPSQPFWTYAVSGSTSALVVNFKDGGVSSESASMTGPAIRCFRN